MSWHRFAFRDPMRCDTFGSVRYLGLPSVVRALRDPLEVQLRQTSDFGVVRALRGPLEVQLRQTLDFGVMVPPYRGSPSIYDCLIH
jgi:hypothetical protein